MTIGDGRVYAVSFIGDLVALNQRTGEEVWKTEVSSPRNGNTMTMAPLYANGMVFVGPVGAEYGVRGFMAAYSAETGKLIWKHWNVPGPGEPGHERGRAITTCGNGAVLRLGTRRRSIPKLGLIYYSTANAGEDFEGGQRPGDNLYASTILALNVKTGNMVWYYQEVRHDIWDFDASSPTVLMNVEADGKMVEGIAQPSKTGYVYFLNRRTGTPVYPIPEKPVLQNPADHTAPKQPIPTMQPFSPVRVTPAQVRVLQEAVNSATPKRKKIGASHRLVVNFIAAAGS